ncbi:Transposon gamma-delta resolvase [Anaerolineae bacterium]|nr:Transposon gamma-delta resolvase [Anaerolineae bacterium]
MKAVGYIRVSSEMQVKQGHSLDMQRKMITDYVQSKGWVWTDLFCETARTGRLTDRPALQMLFARAKHGEFDVIVVTSFDRFHRHLLHFLLALDQLRQWNVSFVSIIENIDFTTPWGKVALEVIGSLAEIYCDRLSLETKRGKQGRVLKGLWNGSIPLGYCNGFCSTCTDVNGLHHCPHYGESNRGDGILLTGTNCGFISAQGVCGTGELDGAAGAGHVGTMELGDVANAGAVKRWFCLVACLLSLRQAARSVTRGTGSSA